MPRCSNISCRSKFTATYFLEKFCKRDECKEIEAGLLLEKARSKQGKAKKKAWKKEKAQIKEKLKSKSDYEKDLQKEVNKIVRLIDKDVPCISSGRTTGQTHGGHFFSRGSTPSLRFNLHNIYAQSAQDNTYKSGNIQGFRSGIESVYGESQLELIENDLRRLYPALNLSVPELKEAIVEARKIAKELEQLGLSYPPKMRLKLRAEFNNRLSIYK